MTSEEVLDIFKKTGALLEGHFIYASGRHGNRFLQAARVLQQPSQTERLCKELAGAFGGDGIEAVIGPATGGIILAYETARHLPGARAGFTEKDGDGGFALKRGFALRPGTRVLVVEDIVTTGGSVEKTVDHLRLRGADVAGVGVLIDRSGGTVDFGCKYRALGTIKLDTWATDELPGWLAALPVIEPDDIQVTA